MFGGNLPDTDDWTLSLLTNAEVLAVNQTSANNRELFASGDALAYAADAPGTKSKYLALFNIGDQGLLEIKAPLEELGLSGKCALRDIWQKKDLEPVRKDVVVKVGAHTAVFFCLKPLE